MRQKLLILKAFMVVTLVVVLLPASSIAADPPSPPPWVDDEPAYGTAMVDGDPSEWDLDNDFFAYLYKAGNPNNLPPLGKAYLRYDCSTFTLYVYVQLEEGHIIDATKLDDHFVKEGGDKLVDANSQPPDTPPDPPDFEWVYQEIGDPPQPTKVGWEASTIPLEPGWYTDLSIHTQVDDDETAAVEGRSIDLYIRCWELGDLPDKTTEDPSNIYPDYDVTRIDDDGGRHLVGDLWLGLTVDKEIDGEPTGMCVGDDESWEGDDEDGVYPVYPWTNGPDGGKVRITVTRDDGNRGGLLYGWIDWGSPVNPNDPDSPYESDGSFDQEYDQVFAGLPLSPGTSIQSFFIPYGVDLEDYIIYARFRLYEDPDPGAGVLAPGARLLEDSYLPTGPAINGEVEDYRWNTSPTGVKLSSFAVTAQTGALRAIWETASEVDSLGFNVYRAKSAQGRRTQLNDTLIFSQAPGSATGATYEFVDEAVEPGVDYYYWLEIVDVNGHGTEYGPVIGSPLAPVGPYRILLPFVIR